MLYLLIYSLSTSIFHDNFTIIVCLLDDPLVLPKINYSYHIEQDASLIIVHGQSGALSIKMLKRLADLDRKELYGAPPEQDMPLAVPK